MYQTLTFEERGDSAVVTLTRPKINIRQIKELEQVFDVLEDSSPAKVAVIRGSSSGIDFADFDPKEALDIHGFNKWEKLVGRLERLAKVTVMAIDGECVGGAFQMLLACDLRIGRPGVTLSLPEVRHGFLPGMATWRLAKYVGLGHAKRIALTGCALSAEEARTLGILDDVDPDLDAAIARALQSLGGPNVVAVTLCRRLLVESYHEQFEDAIGNFLAAQSRAIAQDDFLDTLRRERKPR